MSFSTKPPRSRPPDGSLIIAIDATASREPTWDMATHLQARCFRKSVRIGSLDVELIFFRGAAGINAECKASPWMSDPRALAAYMTGIKCRGGLTQWARVLDRTLRDASQRKVGALVMIGDCAEEPRMNLVPPARRLADLGVPIFAFQEDHDPEAEAIFRELAQITHGAYQPFGQGSARQLGELLRAVAVFATGGVAALEKQGSAAARLLLGQNSLPKRRNVK